MTTEIIVISDWEGLGAACPFGTLRSATIRGKEVFSFEYDTQWLARGPSFTVDPDLRLFSGPQYVSSNERTNFGIFLDSSPDRWGRTLMQRREALMARRERRKEKRLLEADYLLGVHDEQRMGGLRFKRTLEGPYLSDEEGMTAPPWTTLRELEQASWNVQDEAAGDDTNLWDGLRLLIGPGSSLGGARPKAGVCDENGNLWIAKFPGRSDDRDMGAWEMVAHQLAVDVGINVPEARLERWTNRHHTFMTKRFDRVSNSNPRKRRHFASALTLLGYRDGTDFSMGASYLELAELLIRFGADAQSDLAELWRRIVFSVCIHNTDDHLRNHGFLLGPRGWNLSPAYDLNADPQGAGLSLNISEMDNTLNLELILEVAPHFRVSRPDAEKVIATTQRSVAEWQQIANALGISPTEQVRMKSAFELQ